MNETKRTSLRKFPWFSALSLAKFFGNQINSCKKSTINNGMHGLAKDKHHFRVQVSQPNLE